ncbi:MAG: hypothetical protein KGI33_08745 [Thaumarchaeota archaeon]|nr:hypothetical protein [Nitrososphaerota archaeon]
MAYENHDDVIALDAGTGFVKCVSSHVRASFPSIYGTRRLTRWEDPKEGTVEAVGYEAVRMSIYPDAVLVRAVLEGRIAEEKAFGAIIKEATRQLGCKRDLGSILVMMGLPYGAATQKQTLEKLVQRTLKPARILVIPQSIGTLLAEDAKTGLVMSIGQGTTELVLFEDLKYIEGISIPQACDYLYDGLDYLEHEKKATEKRRLNLATILANELAVFKTRLLREYDLYLSGGGVLVPGFCEALRKKIPCFKVAKDPAYSNAQGLYKLGTMIPSSTQGRQERSHVP